MALRAIQIGIFGNFQCRLATDPDPAAASPTGPSSGTGWTFTYGEVAFDRRIRFSAPVALRDGLMDGWNAVRVSGVKVNRGAGMVDVAADPLLGAAVGLGDMAYFDQAAGGGGFTQDAVMNIQVRLGQGPAIMLSATPMATPNIVVSTNADRQSEYARIKPARTVAHAGRRAELTSRMSWYAAVFGFMGTIDKVGLNAPAVTPMGGGVLTEVAARPLGIWTLHLDFFRFDADTLVGTANGWIDGVFPGS